MENFNQTTISKIIKFRGVGLHSGKNSEIRILPSDANTGIVFKRTDLDEHNLVKANYQNVTSAMLCTTLKNDYGVKVSTVEHLLAALHIAKVDNVLIEINNEEVPIMDGSAKDFLKILKNNKKKYFIEKRNYLSVLEKFELTDGDKKISIEPSNEALEVEFKLNYDNKVIGKQNNTVNFNSDNLDDVCKSRTFCLLKDIEKIKKAGLAKGGSLDNAIVVDEDKVLNEGGLRNEKEFVNHKILDLVGDFALSGYTILGKVSCYQGGHLLTNKFLRKLFNEALLKKFHKTKKIKISENLSQGIQEKIAITA